ncbi:Uncharacterized protein QTN25_002580 [Entamoeba marina]
MNTTLTFSIHYVTVFGQNVVINFNDGTSKTMVWKPDHVWTTTYTTKKNEVKWWYTIVCNGKIQRIEQIEQPRSQRIAHGSCIRIQDRWGQSLSDIQVMKLHRIKKSKPFGRYSFTKIVLPHYKITQLKRKYSYQHSNYHSRIIPYFKGVRFGCFDDTMLYEKPTLF